MAGHAVGDHLADAPVTDVRLTGGRIAECAPGLRAAPEEPDIDVAGCALLPGLHDHHVHLQALAAALSSVPAGPPQVRTAAELRTRMRAGDELAPPDGRLRCVGYHESVMAMSITENSDLATSGSYAAGVVRCLP
jgi:predicted amidohydrolase YtcJ